MGLGLRLRLWGSTVGHHSNSWASLLYYLLIHADKVPRIQHSSQNIG